jgi:hypothetical protein
MDLRNTSSGKAGIEKETKMFKTLIKMITSVNTPVDAKLESVKKKYVGVEFLDNGTKTATRKIVHAGRSKFNDNDFYLVIHATNTDKKYTVTLSNFSLKDHVVISN